MKETERVYAAKQTLKQIEERDSQCSFWLVSAVSKLAQENPKMTVRCFRDMLASELRRSFSDYQEYLRNT